MSGRIPSAMSIRGRWRSLLPCLTAFLYLRNADAFR